MVGALLGLIGLAVAMACGIAVYRTGQVQPMVRAVVTVGVLLVTPAVAFWLFALTLTSQIPVAAVVVPIGLLGLGLYIVAEGTVPSLPLGQPR